MRIATLLRSAGKETACQGGVVWYRVQNPADLTAGCMCSLPFKGFRHESSEAGA